MNSIADYLLKSGIILAILYSFYWLFLRKDTYFLANRIVLLLSVIVSLTIPLISLELATSMHTGIPNLVITFDEGNSLPSPNVNAPSPQMATHWNLLNWLFTIYITGAILVLARLIYQAIYLHAVSRTSQTIKRNNIQVVLLEKTAIPFSYFNKIFIPKSLYADSSIENIIEHERSHLQQYHFIDIILIQILTVIHWFNPFAWLFERSVKEIHEFLADKTVLRSGFDQGKYQALLVNQALGGPVFTITNQFNQSLIKKRIRMMTRMKSPRRAQYKALLIVPLIAVLTLAFSNPLQKQSSLLPSANLPPEYSSVSESPIAGSAMNQSPGTSVSPQESVIVKGTITSMEGNKPVAGAAVVIKGTTTGTMADLEGKYTIQAKRGNILVFSSVGFKSRSIKIENETQLNVLLESATISIDFTKENYLIAPIEVENTQPSQPDVFVMVEELPSYPGGIKALKKFMDENINYPRDAKSKKIQGTVWIKFSISETGEMTNIQVTGSVYPSLDKEAVRVAGLITGWKPAKQGGKPVISRVAMPMEFKL